MVRNILIWSCIALTALVLGAIAVYAAFFIVITVGLENLYKAS